MNENQDTAARKRKATAHILETLSAIPAVVSVTLTGSFVDRPEDLDGVSDIDTIVVVDEIVSSVFLELVGACRNMDPEDLGFPGWTLRVNASLGPLKFDAPDLLVIHLMVYDRAGHRTHVLKSPFTCLDWERSRTSRGPNLRSLYPVLALSPRDFLHARRGSDDYLSDLERNVISYRAYEVQGDRVVETPMTHQLDSRHKGEFAYHILRNGVLNALKWKLQANLKADGDGFLDLWKTHFPRWEKWVEPFLRLRDAKRSRREFPEGAMAWARGFVQDSKEFWTDFQKNSVELILVRHGPTSLNDGRFLGRRTDPPLQDPDGIAPLDRPVDRVLASPMKRTVETARRLAPGVEWEVVEDLIEMDYGLAEGLFFRDLQDRFPEIPKGWHRREDPRFPEGENSADVERRAMGFLESLQGRGKCFLVVTHNGVLRQVLGAAWGVPIHERHRWSFPHGKPMAFRLYDGKLYADLEPETKGFFIDALMDGPSKTLPW